METCFLILLLLIYDHYKVEQFEKREPSTYRMNSFNCQNTNSPQPDNIKVKEKIS